jgi:hypothetical protein
MIRVFNDNPIDDDEYERNESDDEFTIFKSSYCIDILASRSILKLRSQLWYGRAHGLSSLL